ncbi:MAG: hypothetical protein HOE11_03960 [Candidatus Diapherotrites archaeon]|jgi:hypothetical protein|nr:hypothetical protein [Candidatus Diapherotrites archaeon]MBT4597161.1 hypothetical protein [Candidatus Diapherotrites archaeon]
MTMFDEIMGTEKTVKKMDVLKLILEEGDNVLKCIKEGMDAHKVRKASVKDINGKLLEGIIDVDGTRENVEEVGLVSAKGTFKFGGDELWGTLEVFTEGKKPLQGKLLRGIAMDNLTIELEF